MFDRKEDPMEQTNVADKPRYRQVSIKCSSMHMLIIQFQIFKELSRQLTSWQNMTNDPWICAPHSVLEGNTCMDLYNDL